MNLWTLPELEAILDNPKRKHVRMMAKEIVRLNEIAKAAGAHVNPTMVGGDVARRATLQALLAQQRTPIED